MARDGVIRRVNLHSVKVGCIVSEALFRTFNIGRIELVAFNKRLFRPRACAGVVFHIGILSCRLRIDDGRGQTVELWALSLPGRYEENLNILSKRGMVVCRRHCFISVIGIMGHYGIVL